MISSSLLKVDNRVIDGGDILFILFFFTGVSAFIISFNFPDEVARLPRIGSGAVIIASILIIFQNKISDYLGISTSQEEEDIQDHNTGDLYILSSIVLLYIILAYLIGFLWSSLVFVPTYMVWRGRSIKHILLLTIIGFLTLYAFVLISPSGERVNDGIFLSKTLMVQ